MGKNYTLKCFKFNFYLFISCNIYQCIQIPLISVNSSYFAYLRLINHITHRTNDNLSCKIRVGKDIGLVFCSSETSALFKENLSLQQSEDWQNTSTACSQGTGLKGVALQSIHFKVSGLKPKSLGLSPFLLSYPDEGSSKGESNKW